MGRKLVKGEFNLEDFLKQLQQIKKMGPLAQILEMIPGMDKLTKDIAPDVTDKQFAQDRGDHQLDDARRSGATRSMINGSRKRRIARGSAARTVQEVNELLNQFRQMQRMMKQMGQAGGRGRAASDGHVSLIPCRLIRSMALCRRPA